MFLTDTILDNYLDREQKKLAKKSGVINQGKILSHSNLDEKYKEIENTFLTNKTYLMKNSFPTISPFTLYDNYLISLLFIVIFTFQWFNVNSNADFFIS